MARADLLRSIGALCEPPRPEHAAIAQALGIEGPGDAVDEAATFLFDVYPYASVHLGEEGMLGGEARSRVTGFWLALGLEPPTEPDHLAAAILAVIVAIAGVRALVRRNRRDTSHLDR